LPLGVQVFAAREGDECFGPAFVHDLLPVVRVGRQIGDRKSCVPNKKKKQEEVGTF
jgi:hypothetical protein